MIDKNFKLTLLTIVKIYIVSISIFFAFRLILFISEFDRLNLTSETIINEFIEKFSDISDRGEKK